MSEARVAERYARALLQLEDKISRDTAKKALGAISQLFDESKIARVLKSPVVANDLKQQVIDNVIDQTGTKDLKPFISEVVTAGRVRALPKIYSAYSKLCDDKDGIVRGKLIAASSAYKQAENEIGAHLSKELGKKVVLEFAEKADLLGGFVVEIGNLHLDLSLRNRINSLATQALN